MRFSVIAAAVELLANIYSAHYLLILFVDQQTVSIARVLLERYASTEAIRLENMIQYVLARLFEYRLRHTFQPYPSQGLDKVGDGVFFLKTLKLKCLDT